MKKRKVLHLHLGQPGTQEQEESQKQDTHKNGLNPDGDLRTEQVSGEKYRQKQQSYGSEMFLFKCCRSDIVLSLFQDPFQDHIESPLVHSQAIFHG